MKEDQLRFDAIFEWRMADEEMAVYKIACIYEREFLKMFSGKSNLDGQTFRRNTLPKKGDPRKSNLFRYCWKLRRETRGLLSSDEFLPYIIANFSIIKMNKGHIEPLCICGDKAWARWKLHGRWVREKAEANAASAPIPSGSSDHKVCMQLDKTKKFLFEKCEGKPSYDKMNEFLENGFFKLWVATSKVSTYYCVLSSYISEDKLDSLAKSCSFDPALVRQRITDGVKNYFKEEFEHEFSTSHN